MSITTGLLKHSLLGATSNPSILPLMFLIILIKIDDPSVKVVLASMVFLVAMVAMINCEMTVGYIYNG